MVHPQSLSVSLRHCFIFHYFVAWRLATGDCATCTLSLADFGLSLASGGVTITPDLGEGFGESRLQKKGERLQSRAPGRGKCPAQARLT